MTSRYRARARRKRENKPINSKWVPYSAFGEGGGTLPGGNDALWQKVTDVNDAMVQLNPQFDQNSAAQLTRMSASSCKIKRFDGAIYCTMPEFSGPYSELTNAGVDRVFVQYSWQKIQATAEQTATVPAAFDPLEPTADEGYLQMARRDILKWGSFILTRTWNGYISLVSMGTPTTVAVRRSNDPDQVVKVPFPRLPKDGLRLGPGETLRLSMSLRAVGAVTFSGTTSPMEMLDSNSEGEIDGLAQVFPHFRYLVSFDD